ncbi:MAG TPA: tRNA pseudouridine(55) synthase TruB [Candidatus Kapabacteria bacterium]|nr:tRNA pseudouridine(55) synthase TruB [Candidatus Kapabacteria bacterium]
MKTSTKIENDLIPIFTKSDLESRSAEVTQQLLSLNGGMLLVDKIYGVTSFVVVYSLRKQLSSLSDGAWIKVGHAGTLDPLATGLVIVGSRRATRSLTSFLGAEKEYEVELRLGITTPSFDLERPITVTHDLSGITTGEVEDCVLTFIGKQSQTPPIFSAIKQNGKPVYKKAHKGKKVEMGPKEVEIYSISGITVNFPYVRFTVACSKGTYIRSLVNDIGQKLGTGATLINLRRTKIGNFSVTDAIEQSQISSLAAQIA